jgi:hypothetical protein
MLEDHIRHATRDRRSEEPRAFERRVSIGQAREVRFGESHASAHEA